MRIHVDCDKDQADEETPRVLRFDARIVDVAEILDRWFALDHRYFKLRGADRAIYIIRHDVVDDVWDLTLYQRAGSDADSA